MTAHRGPQSFFIQFVIFIIRLPAVNIIHDILRFPDNIFQKKDIFLTFFP